MGVNQDNLQTIESAELKLCDNQDVLFDIYHEIEPILSYYSDKSKIKSGKTVVPTLIFDDPINTMQYINGWEPRRIDRKIMESIIKKIKIHIKSLIEESGETLNKRFGPTYNNTINNIIGDSNNINFGTMYGDAITKIEKSTLSQEEKNEIINQIELIKMIIESNDSKEKKWLKLKNIGKWIFDKSFEVGISLLPIIFSGLNSK